MPLGRSRLTTGPSRRPRILESRPLVPDDLRVLTQPRPPTDTIRTLRERHHRIAALVAAGLPDWRVAALTGISPQTLYRYRKDPAFRELVAQFSARAIEQETDAITQVKLESIANMATMERMVGDQLAKADETGTDIPLNTLFKGIADRMDRLGLGKHTTQTHQHAGMASMLEARERLSRITVIDGSPCPAPSMLPGPDTDSVSLRLRNAQAAPILNRRGF